MAMFWCATAGRYARLVYTVNGTKCSECGQPVPPLTVYNATRGGVALAQNFIPRAT